MIVVADSGSTKADWKIIGNEKIKSISTMGFNPVFHSDDQIFNELNKTLVPAIPVAEALQVYYYGAGCWDERKKAIVEKALRKVFNNANIEVQHDLLAAARATCGNDPGVACILGTGSNSCLYDGEKVIDNVTNLGFLLGDEGSGTHLGKKLVRAYFYRELPDELEKQIDLLFPNGRGTILDKVYDGNPPNVYLASLTKILSQFQEHFIIQKLIYRSFCEFIDRHVRKYKGHQELPVHFIGSVGYHFRAIMETVLKERGLQAGVFIKKPIDYLVQFHTN